LFLFSLHARKKQEEEGKCVGSGGARWRRERDKKTRQAREQQSTGTCIDALKAYPSPSPTSACLGGDVFRSGLRKQMCLIGRGMCFSVERHARHVRALCQFIERGCMAVSNVCWFLAGGKIPTVPVPVPAPSHLCVSQQVWENRSPKKYNGSSFV
jgi:hypothetical protein